MAIVRQDPIKFGTWYPNIPMASNVDADQVLKALEKLGRKEEKKMLVAKFKVSSIGRQMGSRQTPEGKYEPAEVQSINMQAVSGSASEENKTFWEATPTGEIKLGMLNENAWSFFDLNEEVYVYFSKEKLD